MLKRTVLAVVCFSAFVWAGDPGLSRPDIYGTPPSQWNYTLVLTTTAVNVNPGLLGKVIIPATCAIPIPIYDSTTTTPAFFNVVVATLTATAGLSYDFTGLRTLNGLTVGIPAVCTSGAIVTYR